MSGGIRLLVIDDEAAIRRFLRVSLESGGYKIFEAENAATGMQLAKEQRPEVIILDLGLPDQHGLEVLKQLRQWSSASVIVLTASDSEKDKVELLEAGADDYLTKPFSMAELKARLKVALRHSQQTPQGPIFRSGPLEVDLNGRSVKQNKKAVKLTSTEYDLLRLLVKNAGKVVTQRQLLREIWGPNSVEHTHYLRVYVGQLRQKLELDPSTPQLILTEPGVGYRLSIID